MQKIVFLENDSEIDKFWFDAFMRYLYRLGISECELEGLTNLRDRQYDAIFPILLDADIIAECSVFDNSSVSAVENSYMQLISIISMFKNQDTKDKTHVSMTGRLLKVMNEAEKYGNDILKLFIWHVENNYVYCSDARQGFLNPSRVYFDYQNQKFFMDMVKKNELIQGNYFMFNRQKFQFDLSDVSTGNIDLSHIDIIEKIRLSKDLILNFTDFEDQDKDLILYMKSSTIRLTPVSKHIFGINCQDTLGNVLKINNLFYLHQLQNHIRNFTGHELAINFDL